MKDFSQLVFGGFDRGELFLGEGSNSNQFFRLEGFDDAGEVFAAGFLDRFHAVARELVGCDVGAGVFHPNERAEVGDEMILEEGFGRTEKFRKEAPKSAAGNFGAFAVEAGDGALGVFGVWLFHRAGDAHPVSHVWDFTKRNAGLSHAIRSGVHTEKEDLLGSTSEVFQVVAMSIPGVFERVVCVCDGGGELQAS